MPAGTQAAGTVRVAVPASAGAPWAGLALCDRGPCSGSLFPPQAAVACAAVLVPFRGNPETNKKEKALRFRRAFIFGALKGTRTPGLLIRSQTLYPAELPARLQEV